jgi:hypothetical protein
MRERAYYTLAAILVVCSKCPWENWAALDGVVIVANGRYSIARSAGPSEQMRGGSALGQPFPYPETGST